MIPTVGFNMRKVTKGKVTIKLWDLGGQPRFRSMWERYCRGVNAIMYVNVVRLSTASTLAQSATLHPRSFPAATLSFQTNDCA